MAPFKNTIRALVDEGYKKDRDIASRLGGIDLSPDQYDKLKEVGTLSATFSEGVIMAEYTNTGVFERADTPEVVQERLKSDVVDYVQTHTGMHND